jgi:NADP-dependent 3-hydroxy acid dehydrogenase YdfG
MNLPRTLVTGASSGFGPIIAQTFLARGWEVVATMRDPNSKQLPASDRLQVLSLDVTDPKSIENAMMAATDETAPMMIPAGADAQALFESERQSAK